MVQRSLVAGVAMMMACETFEPSMSSVENVAEKFGEGHTATHQL